MNRLSKIHSPWIITMFVPTVSLLFFCLFAQVLFCVLFGQLIDTAGSEEYSSMADHYIRNAGLLVFVASATDEKSVDYLEEKYREFRDAIEDLHPVCGLIVNKMDLAGGDDSVIRKADEWAKEHKCRACIHVSAKDKTNFTEIEDFIKQFEKMQDDYRDNRHGGGVK